MVLSYNGTKGKWVVREDYTMPIINTLFVIPSGYETDLASVPRVLWSIYPPFGKYIESAVLHDALYTQKVFPRHIADRVFFDHMRANDVNLLTAFIFYTTVRFFGIFKWRGKI